MNSVLSLWQTSIESSILKIKLKEANYQFCQQWWPGIIALVKHLFTVYLTFISLIFTCIYNSWPFFLLCLFNFAYSGQRIFKAYEGSNASQPSLRRCILSELFWRSPFDGRDNHSFCDIFEEHTTAVLYVSKFSTHETLFLWMTNRCLLGRACRFIWYRRVPAIFQWPQDFTYVMYSFVPWIIKFPWLGFPPCHGMYPAISDIFLTLLTLKFIMSTFCTIPTLNFWGGVVP